MKRSAAVMGLVVVLAMMLTGEVLFALPPVGTVKSQADKLLPPDLTIDKIYRNDHCRVVVVVKNSGAGPVPDEVWTVHTPQSASVSLYKNGSLLGSAYIWSFDPAKNLKNPGGTATYDSGIAVGQAATFKAVVDPGNVVKEANEDNNRLEKQLACTACCFEGTYDGVMQDTASATCPNPSTKNFVLTITQAACSLVANGELVIIKKPAAGTQGIPVGTYHLGGVQGSGVYTPSSCCPFKGVLNGIPGTATANQKNIDFKCTLCLKNGKWYCSDGTYTNPTGCSGKFTLQQK